MKLDIRILKLTFAAFLIFVWLKLVNLEELILLLKQINPALLIPVVLIFVVNISLSVVELKIILGRVFPVPFFFLLKLNLLGSAASVISPANAGGFLRAYLLKKKFNSSFSRVFGFILLDFLLGLSTTFLIGLIAFVFFALGARRIAYHPGFLLVVLTFLLVGLMVISRPQSVRKVSLTIVRKFAPKKFKKRLLTLTEDLLKAFIILSKTPARLVFAFLISTLILVLAGLSTFFIFASFGVHLDPVIVILVHALFGLANAIPAAPAKIGQYELIGLVIFKAFLSVETSVAAGVVLLSHILGITFVLALGGGILLFSPGSFLPLKKSSEV